MSQSPGSTSRRPHRDDLQLLMLAPLIGIPVTVAAWGYLQLVHAAQHWVWEDLPHRLGHEHAPWWLVILALVSAGAFAGFAIARLPGHGGHAPTDDGGMGAVEPAHLVGILLASFASLSLGAVLGPEAPLLALGSGLGVYAVRLSNRAPLAQAAALAGSVAALAAVFGSPLAAAFMVLEMIGLAGAMVPRLLLPGLLAAGVGSLVFNGLGVWTGLATTALEPVTIQRLDSPDLADILWAIAIGAMTALAFFVIKSIGKSVAALAKKDPLILTPIAGAVVGLCAIVFSMASSHHVDDVLLSGQSRLAPMITEAHQWTPMALILVILLKGLAYGISLGSFRGGAVFPAMFIGAAAGLLVADFPGLGTTPAVAAAMGGLTVCALGAPLSSVLLVTFFLTSAGPEIIAIVIVAVIAAHLTTSNLPQPQTFEIPVPRLGVRKG